MPWPYRKSGLDYISSVNHAHRTHGEPLASLWPFLSFPPIPILTARPLRFKNSLWQFDFTLTPVSCENGDPQNWGPGSPFSHENGDPGPYFYNILGTPGSPFSQEIGNLLVKVGTPSTRHVHWLECSAWLWLVIRYSLLPMQALRLIHQLSIQTIIQALLTHQQ